MEPLLQHPADPASDYHGGSAGRREVRSFLEAGPWIALAILVLPAVPSPRSGHGGQRKDGERPLVSLSLIGCWLDPKKPEARQSLHS